MKKTLLLTLMFFALPLAMLAQTPNMMAMARAELQKRGLNETEVRARLLENGIDVDNIPPAEYANYQGRVTAILNQMQAEKAAKEKNESGDNRAAAAFLTSVSHLCAEMLCRREDDLGMSPAAIARLRALSERCLAMLRVNVGVKHIFGLLSVDAVDGSGNEENHIG